MVQTGLNEIRTSGNQVVKVEVEDLVELGAVRLGVGGAVEVEVEDLVELGVVRLGVVDH
jgi:hypothetical protein